MSNGIDDYIKNYIEKKANFQNQIMEFIDEGKDENNFEPKFQDNMFDVKKVLCLLKIIIDYHHRGNNFYTKMEKLLIYFKEDIKQAFTNIELFNFFSQSKLALLILLENKMIKIDDSIVEILKKTEQDMNFFWPEIVSFYSDHQLTFDYAEYKEKRKLGENDDYLAKLIQADLVEEFISYINRSNISLDSKICISFFETNILLMNKYMRPTLIEYATFHGSIQIFQYLQMNKVELTPSLWIYAIHSNNADIIHMLERNKVKLDEKTCENCYIEAIKCHHNDIARYFLNTKEIKQFYLSTYWEYENYDLIPIDQNSYTSWIFSLKYLYYYIQSNPEFVDLLFKASYLDINRIENGKTLLLMAMENNQVDIIRLLALNPKCNTNIKFKMNDKEYTALIFAIEKNQIEIVKLLLENQNTDPNILFYINYGNEKTALSIAIEKYQIEIIEILLKNRNTDPNIAFKMNGQEYTALTIAIENNKPELVKILLLNENIDPNIILNIDNKTFTALSMTIEKDNFELFKLLASNPKNRSKHYIEN